jgi:hypothetical protein
MERRKKLMAFDEILLASRVGTHILINRFCGAESF